MPWLVVVAVVLVVLVVLMVMVLVLFLLPSSSSLLGTALPPDIYA